MIHELSHLSRVFNPDTHDYATGWPNAANLPVDMAAENADTYQLYAQAVYLVCPVDDDTLQIYNCKEGKHAKELKSQKYGVHSLLQRAHRHRHLPGTEPLQRHSSDRSIC
ncbi:putative neutral protease 2 protein [Lasiodiplodia theobromae]|nr:putative neutral protease 2 protein [Lasiodiplodia theobromae]